MKREELIDFLIFANKMGYSINLNINRREIADAYIETKKASIPPVEGAEEPCQCCDGTGECEDIGGEKGACMTCNGSGKWKWRQPTAEGAEEILKRHMNKLPPKYVHCIPQVETDRWNYTLDAMHEFATLHAQKIADKVVSKRLREELIAFLDKRDHTITLSRLGNIDAVDLYLKSREK